MKAVYLEKKESVIVKEIREQSIMDNEVLIKVRYAGICGSDIHAYRGLHPFRRPPVIMGHEVVGEIVKIGSKITEFNLGDRVTVEPQDGCGNCPYCLKGETNYCDDRGAPGIGKWFGTMAEYFVAPVHCVHKLSESISDEEGALVEPLAVAVHAAEKADIKFGEKVAILGTGPIGLLVLDVIKAAGATNILTTDVMDYPLELAEKKGAEYAFNIQKQDNWVEKAIELNSEKFDKVFVAVGVPNILNDALQLLKKGGKVILVAMFHEEQQVNIENIQGQEKEVIGSFTYTYKDFEKAINLIDKKRVNISDIISHIMPYKEAQKGFDLTLNKNDDALKILLKFD